MPDLATPNLPSRNFDVTEAFYRALGFERNFRDHGWLVLKRGPLVLEFFPHASLEPRESWFSACFHMDSFKEMIETIEKSGIATTKHSIPRYQPPATECSGLTIAYLVDPDGSLIRMIENG